MRRQAADATIVATQTTGVTAVLLGAASVIMLAGVVLSLQPLAFNATLAPIAFALVCTVAACSLIWIQSRRALRTQGDLEDARTRQRTADAIAFDAVLTLATDGRVESLNPAAERVFGLSRDAAVGRAFDTLVELPDASDRRFSEVVALGGARRAATPRRAIGRRADGATFAVEVAFADVPVASSVRVLALVCDLSIASLQNPAHDADMAAPTTVVTTDALAADLSNEAPPPAALADVARVDTDSAPVVLPTRAPPRVLVCDDDPELCSVLEALLRAQGAQPDVAHDLDGAVAAMLARPYDVLLLDLQLAGTDGLDLLRTLPSPQSAPLRQVILLSSDASAQVDVDEFPVAIVERMEKPVRLDLLRRSIQLALANAAAARREVRPTILHVDDDPDIRRLVHDLLAPMGEVIAVATLFEAKRRLATLDPDLVVLDIGLNDGSGLELMPLLIRGAGARIPAIVFSGRAAGASRGDDEVKVFAKSCASFEALATEARRLLVPRGRADARAEAA